MKKFIKIIPMISIIILIVSFVYVIDLAEQEKYTRFDEYTLKGIHLDEKYSSNGDYISDVYRIATDNNVILAKTDFSLEDKTTKIYLTIDDLDTFLQNNFITSKLSDEKGFGATFITESRQQQTYVKDFLNNDKFQYFSLFEKNVKDNVYSYGDMSVYFKNNSEYINFIDDISSFLAVSPEEIEIEMWGQLGIKSDFYTYVIGAVGIVSFAVFFLIVMFNVYKNSKKIGMLQLLGYDFRASASIFIHENIKPSLMIFPLILIGTILMPNVSLKILIQIVGLYIFSLVVYVLIILLAVYIISRRTKIVDSLKNRSMVDILTNISMIFKAIISISFVFITVSITPSIVEINQNRANYLGNKIVDKYAVFPNFKVDKQEIKDEDFVRFYKNVRESNIPYLYSDFRQYTEGGDETVEYYDDAERAGTAFRIAVVDESYLIGMEIEVLNKNSQSVDINFDKTTYLFPISKIEVFDKFYAKVADHNSRLQISGEPTILFYEDSGTKFKTFAINSDNYEIRSPFIRVVGNDVNLSYNETFLGIDSVGSGMNTALKFEIVDSKKETYDAILPIIEESGLESIIPYDNFQTYSEYLGTQNITLLRSISLLAGILTVIILVYLYVVVQIVSLYIESYSRDINIKMFLGFKKRDIFRNITIWCSAVTIIPIIAFMTIMIITNQFPIVTLILTGSFYIIVDYIICSSFINFVGFKKTKEILRGN